VHVFMPQYHWLYFSTCGCNSRPRELAGPWSRRVFPNHHRSPGRVRQTQRVTQDLLSDIARALKFNFTQEKRKPV
jgi:hypothetical protein